MVNGDRLARLKTLATSLHEAMTSALSNLGFWVADVQGPSGIVEENVLKEESWGKQRKTK